VPQIGWTCFFHFSGKMCAASILRNGCLKIEMCIARVVVASIDVCHSHTHGHARADAHGDTHTSTHTDPHRHIHTQTCKDTYAHTPHRDTRKKACACTHIHTHTHTHHTHRHTCKPWNLFMHVHLRNIYYCIILKLCGNNHTNIQCSLSVLVQQTMHWFYHTKHRNHCVIIINFYS